MDPKLVLSPRKQKYFKICNLVLSALGLWPEHVMPGPFFATTRRQKHILIGWLVYFLLVLSAMVHYVTQHLDKDFFEISELLASCLIAAFAIPHLLLRILHDKSYGELFKEFYDKMHLSNYRSHDDFTMKILLATERSSATGVITLTTSVVIAATFYILVPIFINVANDAYFNRTVNLEPVLYLSTPFNTENDVRGWAGLSIIILPVIYATPIIGSYTALSFSFFVFHLRGHVDILKYNIRKIINPSVVVTYGYEKAGQKFEVVYTRYTEEDEMVVSVQLKEIAKQHCLILKFRNLIQTVYGELLMSIYLFNIVGYCLILLQLTRGLSQGMARYGIIALILLAQMSFFSLSLDRLNQKLNSLTTELYQVPWPAMRRRNTQTLRCMMLMTQKSTRFTAAGMSDVSAPVMISILRTSISYFVFLQSVDNN
uniref:Odorant receptor n=1 Tax=Lampronia capitella TaxID=485574 RepID=A0A2Z4EY51_9NEOP|nr:odorant receptor 5 [Lampronia capitella]